METRAPRASIRRLVRTSNGLVLVVVSNTMGGLVVHVHVYDDHGWEVPARELTAQTPINGKTRSAYGARQRDSLAAALAEAADIPRGEAEQIATQTLGDWPRHLSEGDLRKAREARVVLGGILVGTITIVIGVVALLVVVLVL